MSTSPIELQVEIQKSAQELGQYMDATLPNKQNWLLSILGIRQLSERALVQTNTAEGIYTRAWLRRPIARTALGSSVELVTSTLTVNPFMPDRNSMEWMPQVVAVYTSDKKLKLDEQLGTPQEETMQRITELGSYVAAIAEANKLGELKRAVSHHDAEIQDLTKLSIAEMSQ